MASSHPEYSYTTLQSPGNFSYLPNSPLAESPDSFISDNNSEHESCSSSTSGDNASTGHGKSARIIPGLASNRVQSSASEGSPQDERKKKSKGSPYIPSYMDLTNGPEPCVVCSDAATGYHYKCMTCEGCKGFFRRTIQNNLSYHCKWNNVCVIDKTTRNQCQQCRIRKCLRVGMATELVLNEKQRKAKRKLIEDNREKRRHNYNVSPRSDDPPAEADDYYILALDHVTENDERILYGIRQAYEESCIQASVNGPSIHVPEQHISQDVGQFLPLIGDRCDPVIGYYMANLITPSILKVIQFAKRVPGFSELYVEDQMLLLKSCCMEIMCLRMACRYNLQSQSLQLYDGAQVTPEPDTSTDVLITPLSEFAASLSKLSLDSTERALLAAVLLVQSDRLGLVDSEGVERLQDQILGAFKRYVAQNRPAQPVHWAKILMKVTDLRALSNRHADSLLAIKLNEGDQQVPPLFLQMFADE